MRHKIYACQMTYLVPANLASFPCRLFPSFCRILYSMRQKAGEDPEPGNEATQIWEWLTQYMQSQTISPRACSSLHICGAPWCNSNADRESNTTAHAPRWLGGILLRYALALMSCRTPEEELHRVWKQGGCCTHAHIKTYTL